MIALHPAHPCQGHRAPRRLERGLTLVELMVAMTIGLMITVSILTVYINSSRNFAVDERYARMQENARYALRVLGEDLVMSDFWGQMISTDTITTTLSVTAGDCGDDPQVLSADRGLMFNNRHDAGATEHFAECAAISAQRQGSSDVILIKRVGGSPTARAFVDAADTDGDGDTAEVITTGTGSLDNGTVYLRTNGISGSLIDNASAGNPPTEGWSDWRYRPRIYFVRDHFQSVGDGIPSLCRLDIAGTDLDALSCLAQGIEDMHLEFGVDTDRDGSANRYTASPTVDEMETVVSARIHVLTRSDEPVPFYTNTKSFKLGGVDIPAANDGFLRNVFSTTVALRNSASRNIFN